MMYMHEWYFIYMTPQLAFVTADMVNKFGAQLYNI